MNFFIFCIFLYSIVFWTNKVDFFTEEFSDSLFRLLGWVVEVIDEGEIACDGVSAEERDQMKGETDGIRRRERKEVILGI